MDRRLFVLWLACAGVTVLSPSRAFAHAFLEHADPPVGGTVSQSPKDIRLWFSEPVEPRFSKVTVTAESPPQILTPPVTRDPNDAREIVVSLPVLPAGRYKVSWRVISVDTHETEGAFTFEVKP